MTDPTNSKYRYISFKDEGYRRYVQEKEKTGLQAHSFSGSEKPPVTHGTYAGLLFDPRWKSKRTQILLRDSNRCVNCSGNNGLQVHHRQYHFILRENQFKLPWAYEDALMITLCEKCHKSGHSKYKVPIINI